MATCITTSHLIVECRCTFMILAWVPTTSTGVIWITSESMGMAIMKAIGVKIGSVSFSIVVSITITRRCARSSVVAN